MEHLFDRFLDPFGKKIVPGAASALFLEGTIAFKKSYGLADLKKGVPVNELTNFRIASVTKQFTAMAVMMLNEGGKISLDDTLVRFFPDFPPAGREITIRQLLTHTSGLVNYEEIIPEDFKGTIRDRDVLRLLKTQHGTYFTPGTQYRYSNSGYALLALIVEEASGEAFPDFTEIHIFKPLGMKGSIVHREGVTDVKNRAWGYSENEAGFVFADQSRTSKVLGDGGIYTSVMDYFRWDQALYGQKLVKKKTLAEAFRPGRLSSGALISYGFGWRLSRVRGYRVTGHDGGTCGFNSAVRRVPAKRLTLVIFSNRSGRLARESADQILERLLGD